MNDEAKQFILNYLCGNIEKQSGSDVPQFGSGTDLSVNISNEVMTRLNNENITMIGKLHNEDLGAWLVYGNYYTTEWYGYVIIFDDNLNVLQFITKYTSGATLFPFVSMNIDEDNYFYALSRTMDGTVRVLLLNNILGSGALDGTYSIKIRKSYISDTSYLFSENPKAITKVQGQSVYYLIGRLSNKTQIIKAQLDTTATFTAYATDYYMDVLNYDVIVSSSGINFYGIDFFNSYMRQFNLVDTTLTNVRNINLTTYSLNINNSEVMAYDVNNIYMSCMTTNNSTAVLKINLDDNTIYKLQEWGWTTEDNYQICKMETVGNVIFTCRQVYASEDDTFSTKYGVLWKDVSYEANDFIIRGNYITLPFFITNSYMIFKIIVPKAQTSGSISYQMLIDINGYIGAEYENINALTPLYGVVQNNDTNIFARRLYNVSVESNKTTGVLQIPNTMLNDITMTSQAEYSETKKEIAKNETNITKNIYEELYINFVNSINIINKNDENNVIISTVGQARLNDSISLVNDYDDSKITKFRVNYQDNTTLIGPVGMTQDTTLIKYIATFNIYVDKEIKSIDLISEDEDTIYITITGDFEIGNVYQIKQDIRRDN